MNDRQNSPEDMSIEKELGLAVKICPQCGARNLPSSQNCFQCGAALPEAASPAKKFCPGCRTVNEPTSQYCYKCGLPLPAETVSVESGVRPAGFWIRLAAYLIDWVILLLPAFLIQTLAFPDLFNYELADINSAITYEYLVSLAESALLAVGITVLVEGAYHTFCIGRWGRTAGKALVGIRVVRADGSRVSYLRALARYFADQFVISITSIIGALVISLTIAAHGQKRGLHDLVCDTMVVRT